MVDFVYCMLIGWGMAQEVRIVICDPRNVPLTYHYAAAAAAAAAAAGCTTSMCR